MQLGRISEEWKLPQSFKHLNNNTSDRHSGTRKGTGKQETKHILGNQSEPKHDNVRMSLLSECLHTVQSAYYHFNE